MDVTYTVMFTTKVGRQSQWETYKTGLTPAQMRCAVEEPFRASVGLAAQVVAVNEARNNVVGRYEEVYDSRRKCYIVKRISTR